MDLKATLTFIGHEVQRAGKVYVNVDSVTFPFTVSKLILNFENFLKGNKEISTYFLKLTNLYSILGMLSLLISNSSIFCVLSSQKEYMYLLANLECEY